ncbi:amino acid synthesis family protein [Alsobacter sp. SYSU M60028]|uniref:Amino acid synthesis family protein n=1 Tax=Alsobacter ponti TaxID=2962936 RepID=A0ABT1LHL5_9HYPH|nr:amino acid synthesis family protein [Alsobacter ponti]MCP8941002.1 amino acid synthesis family protein [Alsobacter ponti]
MATIEVRRRVLTTDRTWREGGPPLDEPIRRGWAAAILANPFAGRYCEDLIPFMESLEPLAFEMTGEVLEALGARPARIESYGKGSIVGVDGELEHAAIWHNPGGAGIRRALGGGKAGVPGSMKVGGPGCTLDLSLGNMDAANVRSHYDSLSVTLGDAPRPAELVVIVALATGGRPHARLGSLISAEEARRAANR